MNPAIALAASFSGSKALSAYILEGSTSKSAVIEITSNGKHSEKAVEFCENLHCGNIVRKTDCLRRSYRAVSTGLGEIEIVCSTDFGADTFKM
jgi:hypothetical protein